MEYSGSFYSSDLMCSILKKNLSLNFEIFSPYIGPVNYFFNVPWHIKDLCRLHDPVKDK